MLVFNPSKMKFFKKDVDGDDQEGNEGVKTFFDTLNLRGGNDGKSEEKEEDVQEDEEENDENDEDEDDENDSPNQSPEFLAIQKQLEESQAQTAKLLAMLEKNQTSQEDEEEELENPFENESFENLAKAMDWDSDERQAMKAFMQNALSYQTQTTLSTATASIDNIVNSKLSQAEKKKAVQKQFFIENPKLHPVKDYVSTIATGVMNEYKALGKDLNPAEILNEAATRAYKALGIDPKAKGKKDNESESDHNPAFPSSRGNSKKRNQKVNKTTTQKMITSMIDL